MINKISKILAGLGLVGFLGPIAYSMIYSSAHDGNSIDLNTGVNLAILGVISLVVFVIFGVVFSVSSAGTFLRKNTGQQPISGAQTQEIRQTSKIETIVGIISALIIIATGYYLFR